MSDKPVRRAPSAVVLVSLAVVLVLSACSGPSSSSATSSATATKPTATAGGGTSGSPAATATMPESTPTSSVVPGTPTGTPAATSTGSATTTNGEGTPSAGSSQQYLDDRSSAEEVIRSYYNAINMQQYARAYSYWESQVDAAQLAPFDQFKQGYATTLHVDVTFGKVGGGVAAGNLYFAVPVELVSKTSDKGAQSFVGCYTIHLGQPANQVVPPYVPMQIQSADIAQVASTANVTDQLANACPNQPEGEQGDMATGKPNGIGAGVYLDDRSDGAEVVRSLYNAINRQEYARAYSYWEPNLPSSTLPPFDQFKQGYANTKSVDLTVGNVTTDAGAGQRYASVPVTIVSSMSDGSSQTFVGCYVTHLASPDIQTSPPFQPMSLMRATVNKVDNNADTHALMSTICNP